MAYSRTVVTPKPSEGAKLTSDMVGIGMLFAATASTEPNIEDTLIAASVEAMERDELRILAVLTTWLDIHHPRVNADRLFRALEGSPSPRVRAFWGAVGTWLGKDRRLARLATLYDGPRIDLMRTGSEFQVRRRGEDARFRGTRLRVPAGVVRDRRADVLSPTELAGRHRAYRQRIRMGPSYRADLWAILERDPRLPAAELARRSYGSFASAWKVKQDWALLHPKSADPGASAGGGTLRDGAL